MRGKSCTRQTLSDAWDATNFDGLCGTLWQMVAPEFEVERKSQLTKKERDFHCQALWWQEPWRLSQEDSTCCLLTSELTVTQEVVWLVQHWHRMEERSNHTAANGENESERLLREP